MLVKEEADRIASLGKDAASDALEKNKHKMREDPITSKFVHSYDEKVKNIASESRYDIYSDKFFDSNRNSPETITGGDLIISSYIQTKDGTWGSGLIAQAKSQEQYTTPPISSLKDDCQKMLCHTPSSFVVIYYPDRFRFHPASSILNLDESRYSGHGASNLFFKPNQRETENFLKPFFSGFSGDPWIAKNIESLLDPVNKPISHRGMASDGGEVSNEDGDGTPAALIFVFSDTEEEGVQYDRLPFSEDGPVGELRHL